MDSLSMASSPGEQRSSWALNVVHLLQITREKMESKVDNKFWILKVPEYQRHPSVEYTPVEWRFGLHNRDENLYMSDSEAAKRAVAVLYGLDKELDWTRFCDAVVPDARAMSECYGLHKEVNGLLETWIKQVLAFDALFLAVWIELRPLLCSESLALLPEEFKSNPGFAYFYHTFQRCFWLVGHDVCKIENQIPLDLIRRAMSCIEELDKQNNSWVELVSADAFDLERWMKKAVCSGVNSFMDISEDFYEGANAAHTLSRSHHILDVAYKVVCGVGGIKRTSDDSQEDYIHVKSATRLKDSGIRIEGVAAPLSAMAYDQKKKCLYLPKMSLYDNTVSVVRNMARYEEYLEGREGCMFHDYVFLMLDLIQTPLDVEHLVKCGVIYNPCGNKAVDMWRALVKGLSLQSSSMEHNVMKSDINERCKLRRHRLWSEFKTLFLSRPWLTLSTVAITLVTFATLIQTYVAVISSNGMKPQFKP